MQPLDDLEFLTDGAAPANPAAPGPRTGNQWVAPDPAAVRFWHRVSKSETGCWDWTGNASDNGYGHIRNDERRTEGVHRFSFRLHVGPIPKGLDVCHRCDNKRCVRPDHLYLGTRRQNLHDAVRTGRIPTGEAHRCALLTNAQVRELRSLASNGWSRARLAARYGLTSRNVGKIVRRESYPNA